MYERQDLFSLICDISNERKSVSSNFQTPSVPVFFVFVFLTICKVFGNQMKHSFECLILIASQTI